MKVLNQAPSLAPLLQRYFTENLIAQRAVSDRTVESYRDTFRLMLTYARSELRKTADRITMADLAPPFVLGFLDQLESKRGNSARTRNIRLAAIRSFMRYASLQDARVAGTAHTVLAVPFKKFVRPLVGFLSREEMQAVLDAPSARTWSGHRDRVFLLTAYNTGARVSELVQLNVGSVHLERSARVQFVGKGRKERAVPLWPSTATALGTWFRRLKADAAAPAFPNRSGGRLTRSGVENRLRVAVSIAADKCPDLHTKRVSPHVLRHTTAMHLLQSGVDISVIALWLGHESPSTTHQYIEADLAMKERALTLLRSPNVPDTRYRPTSDLLAFLDGLQTQAPATRSDRGCLHALHLGADGRRAAPRGTAREGGAACALGSIWRSRR